MPKRDTAPACPSAESVQKQNTPAVTRASRLEELPEFLTPADVQVFLNLSRNVVYDLVACGTLRSVRFGRQIRVPSSALIELAASSTRAGERRNGT